MTVIININISVFQKRTPRLIEARSIAPAHTTADCQNRNSNLHLSGSKSHVFTQCFTAPSFQTHLSYFLHICAHCTSWVSLLTHLKDALYFFLPFSFFSCFAFPPDMFLLKCISFLSFLFSGDLSLLKSCPFLWKATFPLIPSLTLFCPFPWNKQLCDLNLCLNGPICSGCYHIHAF